MKDWNFEWKNGRAGKTPLSAENLNKMSDQINALTSWVNDYEANAETGGQSTSITQLYSGSGPNRVELRESIYGYNYIIVRGWIDKHEGNNYAFNIVLPAQALYDGGMYIMTDYDELWSGSAFQGTITSAVFRYRQTAYSPGNPEKYILYIANRSAVQEEAGKEVLKNQTQTQGIGAIGRYLDNLGAIATPPHREGQEWSGFDLTYRTVVIQEVVGLKVA